MPAARKASQSVKEEDVKPYSRPSNSPAPSDVKPKTTKAAKSKAASGACARSNLPAGSKTQLARAVIAAGLKALTNEEAAQIVSPPFHSPRSFPWFSTEFARFGT